MKLHITVEENICTLTSEDGCVSTLGPVAKLFDEAEANELGLNMTKWVLVNMADTYEFDSQEEALDALNEMLESIEE